MQNKLTIAEVLTKLDENMGTVFHKTLFTREEVIKLLNRIEEPQGNEGKINMTKADFKAYVTDLFAKLSVSDWVSQREDNDWVDDYDYDLDLHGNEIEVTVHSFDLSSRMYREIEEGQDQLLDTVLENMCDEFSFIEQTQSPTEQFNSNIESLPTETNGATE